MSPATSYSVLLLPQNEIVAQRLSEREALAWAQTYNEATLGSPSHAIVAAETIPATARPLPVERSAA